MRQETPCSTQATKRGTGTSRVGRGHRVTDVCYNRSELWLFRINKAIAMRCQVGFDFCCCLLLLLFDVVDIIRVALLVKQGTFPAWNWTQADGYFWAFWRLVHVEGEPDLRLFSKSGLGVCNFRFALRAYGPSCQMSALESLSSGSCSRLKAQMPINQK